MYDICRYLCSLASLPIFIRLCTLHAKRLPCGAREKKPSTEVDKYSTGFQITITITTSDQEQINLHTPSPHSTPPIPNTKHTSQSWATEQKQPRSASATPKMPAASQSLSSNPYVFFLSPDCAFAKNAPRSPPVLLRKKAKAFYAYSKYPVS